MLQPDFLRHSKTVSLGKDLDWNNNDRLAALTRRNVVEKKAFRVCFELESTSFSRAAAGFEKRQ